MTTLAKVLILPSFFILLSTLFLAPPYEWSINRCEKHGGHCWQIRSDTLTANKQEMQPFMFGIRICPQKFYPKNRLHLIVVSCIRMNIRLVTNKSGICFTLPMPVMGALGICSACPSTIPSFCLMCMSGPYWKLHIAGLLNLVTIDLLGGWLSAGIYFPHLTFALTQWPWMCKFPWCRACVLQTSLSWVIEKSFQKTQSNSSY